MFKNYLKIAMRNLLRHRAYSAINISGLAIGMASCILILLYVRYELSYDRFHQDAENVYRIAWFDENPQTRTPHPMAQAMAMDFLEVESAVSISPLWGPGLTRPTFSVRYGNQRFDEKEVFSADTSFFRVFSFPLVQGNPFTALQEPSSIIISQRIAEKYFGDEEPMGKVLRINNDTDLKVAGVLKNVPANSHFHFDFLVSYLLLKPQETGSYYTWDDFGHYNYIRLKAGTNPKTVEAKMPEWAQQYLDWPEEAFAALREGRIGFRLQRITDIHLHSHIRWELGGNSDIAYVYLFSAIAVFILLIACINFMNLSTARSATRAKEVGMRKVLGAFRQQLVGQFLGEAILLSVIALLIAIVLIELLLPAFNALSGRELVIGYLDHPQLFFTVMGIALLVGIVSGSYPAFFLSAYQPARVLKGATRAGGRSFFRRALVVVQFALSIALMSGTVIVSSQLDFLRSRKLGFEKEQVVVVPMKHDSLREQFESIKAELLRMPGVLNVSATSNVPGGRFNQNQIQWQPEHGLAQRYNTSQARVDYDFLATLGIEIEEGRGFSKEISTDGESAFMLNETAARLFDWDSAVGREITWFDDDNVRRGTVIGVARDFHFQSLHKRIEPLIMKILPESYNYVLVKIGPEDVAGTLALLEQKWKAFDPEFTFEYSFLDADFAQLYRAEEKIQALFRSFTVLAIFIACLGLFGLASFTAQQRTKEIGMRKVLGASVAGVAGLLSKDFAKLVIIANVVAWPMAYFAMHKWLQNFAYRIDIEWWVFALAGAMALFIALLTVSTQAIRAALANPVDSLRYE